MRGVSHVQADRRGREGASAMFKVIGGGKGGQTSSS